jgi:predicted ATPase
MAKKTDRIDECDKSFFLVNNNPGSYALVLGSGVSFSAKIPTGWGVMCELISRYAKGLNEDISAEEAYEWYIDKYDKEPDYSDVLNNITNTPDERSSLLRSFFEPSDEEARDGVKMPTPAHRAIAQLMKYGFISVVITTNFDRLLEKALYDINSSPIVITTKSDVDGFAGLIHEKKPVIIKVNGDYLDTRIKNTSWELSNYENEISELLKSVFNNYGIIISGWSGVYDRALVNILNNSINNRYSHYWVNPVPPDENVLHLSGSTKFQQIKKYSDDYFRDLAISIFGKDADLSSIAIYEKGLSTNIPELHLEVFGRNESVDKLTDLLVDKRLVTLVGPAGIGKTTLSIKLANSIAGDYKEGIWFVDFTSINNTEVIVPKIAESLGVKEEPGRELLNTITDKIHGKKVLLIFDNCEQIRKDISALSLKLLNSCTNLRIIATSREILHLREEFVYFVSPLGLPKAEIGGKTKTDFTFPYTPASLKTSESGKLFLSRARTQNSDFDFTPSNCMTIVQIIKLVDAIPLGIELAASMIRAFTPKEILTRLEKNLLKLENRQHELTTRQLTLHNAIDWSYSLLSKEEKKVLQLASVFEDGFFIDDIKHVAEKMLNSEKEIEDILTNLLDKSFIYRRNLEWETRYLLYNMTKIYCSDCISTDYRKKVVEHLSTHLLNRFNRANDLCGDDISRLNSSTINRLGSYRMCLEHDISINNVERCIEMFCNLKYILVTSRYYSEIEIWYNRIIQRVDSVDVEMKARFLSAYSEIALFTKGSVELNNILTKNLNLANQVGNKRLKSIANSLFSTYNLRLGKGNSAIEYSEKAIKATENDPEQEHLLAYNLLTHSNTLTVVNRYDDAKSYLQRAIKIFMKYRDDANLLFALGLYGDIQENRNDLKGALETYKKVLEKSKKLKNISAEGIALARIGCIQIQIGNLPKANQDLAESYGIACETNNILQKSKCAYHLACSLILQKKENKLQHYLDTAVTNFDKLKRDNSINSTIRLGALSLEPASASKVLSWLSKSNPTFDDTNLLYCDGCREIEKELKSSPSANDLNTIDEISRDKAIEMITGKRSGIEGLIDMI